jgi:hypothetical protein
VARRGPVQAAVRAGDEVTGATTFRLEEGLDTGPTYGVVTETVRPTDTAGDLLGRLAESGARLLVATLDGIADGTLEARPQPADGVSHAAKVGVDDARVDWSVPAAAVDRLSVRSPRSPGPGARSAGERLGLGPVRAAVGAEGDDLPDLKPGELHPQKRRVLAAPPPGRCELGEVRPAGKRRCRPPTGPAACASKAGSCSHDRPTTRRPAPGTAPAGARPAGPRGPPARPAAAPARRGLPTSTRHGSAALELLTAVRVRDAYANLALPAILRRHRLQGRDAGLATELGYGTLRATGPARRVLEECADGRWPRWSRRCWTRCGWGPTSCCAPGCPGTPRWTHRELVRVSAGSRSAGFVNAMLRASASATRPAGWPSWPDARGPGGHAASATPQLWNRAGLRRPPWALRRARSPPRRRRPPPSTAGLSLQPNTVTASP